MSLECSLFLSCPISNVHFLIIFLTTLTVAPAIAIYYFIFVAKRVKSTAVPPTTTSTAHNTNLHLNNAYSDSPMLSRIIHNNSNHNSVEQESISTLSTKCLQKPKYFSGQYEVEVSPTSSPTNSRKFVDSSSSISPELVIMERMVPVTKTVFLIRHAESDENRRLASLSKSFKGLGRFRMPKKEDVMASIELINVPAQIDSDVSPKGRVQISSLAKQIEKDDFVKKMGIQLVAHSPLKRARQTSEGMLGCVTAKPNVSIEEDSSAKGMKAPSVGRVVELPVLSERTPMEWLPINHDAFTQRIAEFEKWLGEQPEDVIAVVGHSQYFKSMLGLPKKFKNCDVWSLQFDSSIKMTHESVKNEINSVERAEKQRVLKKRLQNVFNHATSFRDEKKDETESQTYNGECLDTHDGNAAAGNNDDDDGKRESSDVFENDHEIYEIDGVRVDDVQLPRGWRDLKRHYTYYPSVEE